MASHSFQILSDVEVKQMKRTRGLMACAECQRRKLKCNKQFPCSSCVRRGRADICPTGDMGFIGRGRRLVRCDSLTSTAVDKALTKTIDLMGDRIRQLETAVAEAKEKHSDSTHQLLGQASRATVSRQSSPASVQVLDTSCIMDASPASTSLYLESEAGPSNTASFSFTDAPTFSGSATGFDLSNLLGQLPDELRAWALYHVYIAEASWYCTPIKAEELHELLTCLYNPHSDLPGLSPHAVAVVFLVFALAALADLSLPAYSTQAETYFDLGRAALMLRPIFGRTDLYAVQALVLAGLYYAAGGPRYSMESSWTMTSMAVSRHLHREREHTPFDNTTAQRRRALFWEVYSLETYQSLALGRPLTIHLTDIDCEFPADDDQTMDIEGRVLPGYFRAKWEFTKEVTSSMAQAYASATLPTHDKIMDLDRRLREFMTHAPFSHHYEAVGVKSTFLAYVRAHYIPRLAEELMVHIHRGSFIRALKTRPLCPRDGPYTASFLATYRGASRIIQSDIQTLSLFPDHFHRWWPFWKPLIDAAAIMGAIVAKCATSTVAPRAYTELLAAEELVEGGALHSGFVADNLPALRRLREKAAAVYTGTNSLGIPLDLRCPNPLELVDDTDLEILSGFSHTTRPSKASPPATDECPPSLIPGMIPPPPTPDSWANQVSFVCSSSFPFETPMDDAVGPEKYFPVNMRIPSAFNLFESWRDAVSGSEMEWTTARVF
ncbi:Zn(2)-C6 fungal-type domain-containing protein [Mycena venus]|uniref:Zn(2)-C6 fungal-type domain-containing protein n=1 Tax=Mycena venus TaxID=2733690 RepID=A0A8H6Y0A5_9AGAR|nr:Zn(2)-C6 fungal-type domain-containing protein [Mycena venus]